VGTGRRPAPTVVASADPGLRQRSAEKGTKCGKPSRMVTFVTPTRQMEPRRRSALPRRLPIPWARPFLPNLRRRSAPTSAFTCRCRTGRATILPSGQPPDACPANSERWRTWRDQQTGDGYPRTDWPRATYLLLLSVPPEEPFAAEPDSVMILAHELPGARYRLPAAAPTSPSPSDGDGGFLGIWQSVEFCADLPVRKPLDQGHFATT
jgi:hypothetical protein